MPTTTNRKLHFRYLAAYFFLAAFTLLASGCGDSQEDYVFTNTNVNNPTTGNVVFNFTRAQGVVNVPADTVSLEIDFFSGSDQTGTKTKEVTTPFAASVTVTDVPTTSRSFRITARDANGLPLQQTDGEVTVLPGQTVTADLVNITTVPVTLNTITVTPEGETLAVGETQQFAASGQFSNGESLPLPGPTFVSSNPSVASITPAGLATAAAAGTTTITGTFDGISDDATLTVSLTPVSPIALDVLVSNNGTENKGDLDLFDRLSAFVRTFDSGNNQGIAVDALGTGYHNGDDPNDSVRVLSRAADRTGAFDLDVDREITSGSFGAIKGSAVAQEQGLLFIADAGNSQIHILGTAGTSVISVTTSGGSPWDVAYDEGDDRLFVAFTNGDLGVFDNWVADGFPVAADRTIEPAGSVNLHGISYDAASDTVVVSDVGDAAIVTDGQLFVIPNASTANGAVTPSATIAGSETDLGNPVDIDLANGDLRVAEKSNDLILTFTNILNSVGGNLAATVAVAETKPESLTSAPQTDLGADNSDIDGGGTVVQNLIVSSNPGGDGPLVRVNTGLTTSTTLSQVVSEIESVRIDGQGDAFVTSDSGVLVAGRVGTGVRDTVALTENRDRDFASLSGSKGLDLVDSRDLVIIARTGTLSIVVFGKNSGNGLAIFTTPTTSTPWDVDYDPTADRLYVAFTDGTVGVYDDYLDGTDPNTATPDRVIDPAGGVNLHGIIYDAVNDVLLLSDVGDAGSATDGQLFVVENASTANGAVTPDVTIGGASTDLGNPVDIEYDGTNLYVAEKSNDLVMRFNNIRTSAGGDIAPSVSITVNKPESLSLVTGL